MSLTWLLRSKLDELRGYRQTSTSLPHAQPEPRLARIYAYNLSAVGEIAKPVIARSPKLVFYSALALLSALIASSTRSQPQSAQPAPKLLENRIRVTTNEVAVPVTVTTRHGELVLDLSEAVVREAEQANISIYVVGESSVGADLRADKLDPIPLKFRVPPPITAAPCTASVPGYGDSQCIGFAIPALWLLERGTNEIKHHQLAIAAAATGGFDYSGFRESALQSALDRIGAELHAQYILSFKPPSGSPPGLHVIRVTVARPSVLVRARPGYYLKAR